MHRKPIPTNHQPTSAPVATTATLPVATTAKSLNATQQAARAKTCRKCKKQFESGNKLHKHLRESCTYSQQQQETQQNSTAISKASPYQTTSPSLDQNQTTASNADQITTPKSNDLVEPPTKDAEQSPTVTQLAARAKTCRKCKKQFKSGNKLYKHLRESCIYSQQQQET